MTKTNCSRQHGCTLLDLTISLEGNSSVPPPSPNSHTSHIPSLCSRRPLFRCAPFQNVGSSFLVPLTTAAAGTIWTSKIWTRYGRAEKTGTSVSVVLMASARTPGFGNLGLWSRRTSSREGNPPPPSPRVPVAGGETMFHCEDLSVSDPV